MAYRPTQQNYNYRPQRPIARTAEIDPQENMRRTIFQGIGAIANAEARNKQNERQDKLAGMDFKLKQQRFEQGEAAAKNERNKNYLTMSGSTYEVYKDKTPEEKGQFWSERNEDAQRKGVKAGRVMKMANLYADGSEESAALADKRWKAENRQAINSKYIPAPQQEKRQKPLAIEIESAILNDPNADPEMQAAIRSKWAGSKQSIEYSPDGGFKMVSGRGIEPSKASKPVVGDLQKKQAQIMRSLSNLHASKKLRKDQYGTYKKRFQFFQDEKREQLKGFIPESLEVSKERKQALKDNSKFQARNTIGLSQFLNDLSGAAINEHEMKRLKKSWPSADDVGSVYDGKYEGIVEELQQRYRIYNKLMREGFKGNSANEVSKRYAEGQDDTAEDRAAWLENQGFNVEEIEADLMNGGYVY